jgi:hypothetical protein
MRLLPDHRSSTIKNIAPPAAVPKIVLRLMTQNRFSQSLQRYGEWNKCAPASDSMRPDRRTLVLPQCEHRLFI